MSIIDINESSKFEDFYSSHSKLLNNGENNGNNLLMDLFQRIGSLQDMRYDAIYNISQLKQRVADIEKRELELMKESTIQHSKLQEHYLSHDDDKYIKNLTTEAAHRLDCMQQELKQLKEQVHFEEQKLKELEEQVDRITVRMNEINDQEKENLYQQRLIIEEQRDQQSQIFEDLEFKELETQSRFEEESEMLKRKIIEAQRKLIVLSRDRDTKKLKLDEQQINLMKETRHALDKLESERTYCNQQIAHYQRITNDCNTKIEQLNKQLDVSNYIVAADQSSLFIEHNGNNSVEHDECSPGSEPTTNNSVDKQKSLIDESAYNSKTNMTHNDSLHDKLESLTEIVRMNLSIHAKADINEPSHLATHKVNRDSFEIYQRQHVDSYPSTLSLSDDSVSMTQTDSAICLEDKADVTFESISTGDSASLNQSHQRNGSANDLSPGVSPNDESNNASTQSTVVTRKKDKVSNRRDKQSRPLTCFLPKMNSDFHLRSHIESCGHDLTVCGDHIQLDRNSCQGFLWKLSNRMFAVYRKRWFYFDQTRRELRYYTSKTKTKLKGTIRFQNISDVFVDHTHRARSPQKLSFCIETPTKTYYLITAKLELVTLWIDVIFTGAEAYLSLHPPAIITPSQIITPNTDQQ